MTQTNSIQNLNFKNKLQDDNVFVNNYVVNFTDVTGMPTGKGFERTIICEDQIVNVVSNPYGHLPNDKFFYEVESKLIDETSAILQDQLIWKTDPFPSTTFSQTTIGS